MSAISSISTGNSQPLQSPQARTERRDAPERAEAAPPPPPASKPREADQPRPQAEEPKPRPVTNLQGQKTGSIINTSA